MKIAVISIKDYAGSGHRIADAINGFTEHRARCITGEPLNYGYQSDLCLDRGLDATALNHAQRIVDEADIIHYKGDWPPYDDLYGLHIPRKPTVITVGGGLFRHLHEMWFDQFQSGADAFTAMTPDLNYPEFHGTYIPHHIDTGSTHYCWALKTPPTIAHLPSSPARKGTSDFIFPALQRLAMSGIRADVTMASNIPYQQSLDVKRKATIYIDQLGDDDGSSFCVRVKGSVPAPVVVGFYGNAAVEAMAFGVPTVAHISDTALAQSEGKLDDCPVVNVRRDVEHLAGVLGSLCESAYMNPDYLTALSERSRRFAETFHSHRAVAEMYSTIYERLA